MGARTPSTAFEASAIADELADWLDQAVRAQSPEEILHASRAALKDARALKRYLSAEAQRALVKS